MEISKTTYDVVTDANNKCVMMDGLLLLCNKSNNEVISVPLCTEVKEEFGLQELEASKNNKHEAGTSKMSHSPQNQQPMSAGIATQIHDKKETEQENIEEDISAVDNSTAKMWSSENTLALIHIVAEHYNEFSLTLKKKVWEKVSTKLSKIINKKITATICETKWKTLKRTYKSIAISNKTSGQKRRHWEFFNVLNDLLFNKPEINPVATCSNVAGFQSKLDIETTNNSKEENEASEKESDTPTSSKFESSFSRKRNQRQSESERRHQEKMSRLDRFNDLFEKMVENYLLIIPNR